MARNPSPRMRAICERCEHEVDRDAETCDGCGAERPVAGWPAVTELRVYTGAPGTAEVRLDPPSLPPAPAPEPEPAPAPAPSTPARARRARTPAGLGLAATFSASFALTMAGVLGLWFGLLHPPRPDEPAPPPVLATAEPEPVREPAGEIPAPVVEEDAVAAAEPEPEVVEPPSRSVPVPSPPAATRARPAPPPPPDPEPDPEPVAEPEPAPEPAPVVVRTPAPKPPVVVPQPVPEPPPPPPVPAEAARQSGVYVGKVKGAPLSLELAFGPEGALDAVLKTMDGDATVTTEASGHYTIGAEGIAFALVEKGSDSPAVYSGTVSGDAVDGRVTIEGRNRGRFHAGR